MSTGLLEAFSDSMPSIRPHLTILRPSPTTVSFTVSTSSPPQSFAALASHWLLLALRLLAALATSLVIAAKYLEPAPLLLNPLSERLNPIPWSYLAIFSVVALILVFRRFHTGMLCLLENLFRHPLSLNVPSILNVPVQKSLSSPYALSASKPAASLLTICCRPLHALFRHLRSAISSSMRLFGGSRSDTI